MTNYGYVLMKGDQFIAREQDPFTWEYTEFLGEAMFFKTMTDAMNFRETANSNFNANRSWVAVNLNILVEH